MKKKLLPGDLAQIQWSWMGFVYNKSGFVYTELVPPGAPKIVGNISPQELVVVIAVNARKTMNDYIVFLDAYVLSSSGHMGWIDSRTLQRVQE